MIDQSDDELLAIDNICLTTIFKAVACHVYFHKIYEPYYQISISGFALDGEGGAFIAEIETSVDGDKKEMVKEMLDTYTDGSLHWMRCKYFTLEGQRTILIHNPIRIGSVPENHIDIVNKYFPKQVAVERIPENNEFLYDGRVFVWK